jgi:hypothetical protein
MFYEVEMLESKEKVVGYFYSYCSLFCIKTLKFQRKMSGKFNLSTNPNFAILGAFLCKNWGIYT